jgi:hypothetical protein
MRSRRYGVLGEHLVTDMSGFVHLASHTVIGKYGLQKGQVVHKDDVDEPSTADFTQPKRRVAKPVKPNTGPPVIG